MFNFLKKSEPDTSKLEFWQGSHYPEQLQGKELESWKPNMTNEFLAEILWMNQHNLAGRIVFADWDSLEANHKTFKISVMRGCSGETFISLYDTSGVRARSLYETVARRSSGMKQKAFDRQVVAALDNAWAMLQAYSR